MDDTITKRVHVGGIIPSITAAHLQDRFRSFGTVTAVEEMGLNALGEPRPFAYITLQTTPVQFRKCLNIMNGATWRGTTLRLAEAKPRFDARLEKERTPNPQKEARRASRRLKRAIVNVGGKEAQDMRLVTREKIARRAVSTFWVEDDGHLIRPLAIRPTHPLPPLAAPKNDGAPPPKRARVRVIDPRRWNPTHVLEEGMPGPVERGEQWEFVEGEEEMGEDGRVRIGAWVRGGDEEDVHVRRPLEWSDAETESEDGGDLPLFPERERSGSPLFPTRNDGSASPLFPAKERSASPLFPTRDQSARDGSSSPLFPARDAQRSTSPLFPVHDRVAILKDEEEDAMERSSRAGTPSPSPARVAEAVVLTEAQEEAVEEERLDAPKGEIEGERAERSPTPPISPLKAAEGAVLAARARAIRGEEEAAARPLRSPTPEISPTKVAASLPDDVRAQAASERGAALSVLTSLLGEAPKTGKARREWSAFEEESDDDFSTLKPQAYESSSDTEIAPVERARAPSPKTPDVAMRARWLEQMELEEEEGDEPATVSNDLLEDMVLRLRGGAPDESDEEDTVLRLRGGAADESDEDDSDSDSDSDDSSGSSDDSDSSDSDTTDSSDDSDDSDSDSDDSDDSGSEAPAEPARLKDLFAPTSGGFSLMGVAPDLDIDETIVLQPTAEEPELAPLAAAPRSTFDASADIPLFFPLPVRPVRRGEAPSVLADVPDVNGEEEGAEEEEGWGAPQPQRRWGQEQEAPKAKDKTRKRFVATETDAAMRERWEKRRLELTQGWKRRHREAVKHRRRRGGDDVE